MSEPQRSEPQRSAPQRSIGDQVDRRDALIQTLRTLAVAGIGSAGLLGCATNRRTIARPLPDLPPASTAAVARIPVEPRRPLPTSGFEQVGDRATWTSSRPNTRNMDRMGRLRYVTVHHDGLKTPLARSDRGSSVARLETIRRGHVVHNRWADIGYHYAIDRSGRIWECRPLSWQGAHVKGHNEGNVGILVMGNFEIERPTNAQVAALNLQISALMAAFGIPPRNVMTHQEWPTARTSCPGRHLQPQFDRLKSKRFA